MMKQRVIDDNSFNIIALETLLEPHQFKIDSVYGG